MRRNGMTSITSQVRRSVASITVLLAVPAVIGLAVMLMYSARTQAMIRRMDAAARMKPVLESTIAENLFSVAAGRCGYADSGVEELITGTNDTLDMLLSETEGSGQMQLTIARRTMDTLEQYVHKVRDGMDAGTPISEIEGIVDEVRNVGRGDFQRDRRAAPAPDDRDDLGSGGDPASPDRFRTDKKRNPETDGIHPYVDLFTGRKRAAHRGSQFRRPRPGYERE